jgi:hypothetical protein
MIALDGQRRKGPSALIDCRIERRRIARFYSQDRIAIHRIVRPITMPPKFRQAAVNLHCENPRVGFDRVKTSGFYEPPAFPESDGRARRVEVALRSSCVA